MGPTRRLWRDNSSFAHFGPALKFPTPYCAAEPMDFRSPVFRATAHYLVQCTGCALLLCRQELFMAEGDAEHAYMALIATRSASDHRPVLH